MFEFEDLISVAGFKPSSTWTNGWVGNLDPVLLMFQFKDLIGVAGSFQASLDLALSLLRTGFKPRYMCQFENVISVAGSLQAFLDLGE